MGLYVVFGIVLITLVMAPSLYLIFFISKFALDKEYRRRKRKNFYNKMLSLPGTYEMMTDGEVCRIDYKTKIGFRIKRIYESDNVEKAVNELARLDQSKAKSSRKFVKC